MIAVVPAKRKDGNSSFADLKRYLVERPAPAPRPVGTFAVLRSAEADLAAAEHHLASSLVPTVAELATSVRSRQLRQGMSQQLVEVLAPLEPGGDVDLGLLEAGPQRASVGGVSCETSCLDLDTAVAEMEGVASMNPRVVDPVYHFVVSWPAEEVPDDDAMFASARHALAALGLAEHQYFAAIHRDTEHAHVHVMANRVHPDTYRVQDVSRDFYTLDRAMRECEIRFGFKHDSGPYVVLGDEHGHKVVARARDQVRQQGKPAKRVQDMERWDGQESFFTFLRSHPRRALLKAFKDPALTWAGLHAALAVYGAELRPKGQGFAVYAFGRDDVPPVKASDVHEDLAKSRLEKRLGPYQVPTEAPRASSAYSYRQGRELRGTPPATVEVPEEADAPRLASRREIRRAQRAVARQALRDAYKTYAKSVIVRRLDPAVGKARYSELASWAKQARAEVKASMLPGAERKARYSLIALEAAKRRAATKRELTAQRKSLREDPANQRLTYRAWVYSRAQEGDEAAIAQMRGWAYADKRHAKRMGELESQLDRNGFGPQFDIPPQDHVSLGQVLDHTIAARVGKDGSVLYRVDDQAAFVDHGRVIRMADAKDLDEGRLLAALMVAREKYGPRFSLTGTQAYKDAAIALIAQYDLPIELKDAAQNARLQGTKLASRPTPYKPRG